MSHFCSMGDQCSTWHNVRWEKDSYDKIMLFNNRKPIGHNLIDGKVEMFKEVCWTGVSDFLVKGVEHENI